MGAKLSLSADEAPRTLAELEDKARRLPFAGRYKRMEARLFVVKNPPPGTVSVDWCEAHT